jgi:hypothetical protein
MGRRPSKTLDSATPATGRSVRSSAPLLHPSLNRRFEFGRFGLSPKSVSLVECQHDVVA